MGRLYTVEFENVAVAASQDLFQITCADDKPVSIHALFLGNISAEGDANEDYLRVRIIRGHTTTGSGGTSPTPVPVDPSSAAAGFTAQANNTTIASAGTAVNIHSDTFNVRVGMPLVFTPEIRPRATQASLLVVRLMAAPDASTNMSGTLYVEEL